MGISIWQLLIVLAIVLLLFGTKKLRNLGADVGGAVKGFKGAMREGTEAGGESADGHLEQSTSSAGSEDEAASKKGDTA